MKRQKEGQACSKAVKYSILRKDSFMNKKITEEKMKGIIFDVDGTLWDSTEMVAVAWNKVIKDEGIEHKELEEKDLKKSLESQWKRLVKVCFRRCRKMR